MQFMLAVTNYRSFTAKIEQLTSRIKVDDSTSGQSFISGDP